MGKRTSSAQLNHVAKRQRSNENLCDEVSAGQISNENMQDVPKSCRTVPNEVDGRRSSEGPNTTQREISCSTPLVTLPDILRIQWRDQSVDPRTDSETRHVTTPLESYCPSHKAGALNLQAVHSSELDSQEERLQRMDVKNRNHPVSQCTIYQPGLENTEERYNRKLVASLYGTVDSRYHLPVDEEEAERSEIGHMLDKYHPPAVSVRAARRIPGSWILSCILVYLIYLF
jgi:hypothetical protein